METLWDLKDQSRGYNGRDILTSILDVWRANKMEPTTMEESTMIIQEVSKLMAKEIDSILEVTERAQVMREEQSL